MSMEDMQMYYHPNIPTIQHWSSAGSNAVPRSYLLVPYGMGVPRSSFHSSKKLTIRSFSSSFSFFTRTSPPSERRQFTKQLFCGDDSTADGSTTINISNTPPISIGDKSDTRILYETTNTLEFKRLVPTK
jgi:hypothetical protein